MCSLAEMHLESKPALVTWLPHAPTFHDPASPCCVVFLISMSFTYIVIKNS